MKKIFMFVMAFAIVFSVSACAKKEEAVTEEKIEITEEKPSGIEEDGIGEDASFGEGIGEVIAISDEDRAYIMDMSTNGWLEMTDEEKDEFTSLLGRWWEETEGYIVPDYDEMVMMLDRQCEQYFRYDVNENLYTTACDIFKVGAFGGNEGEGIGMVVTLTDDEKAYVMDKLTNDWLEMDDEEKENYVSLMARLMEAEKGYIVPDFEEIRLMLDRQSEQYFKNGVNEGVYVTACDILGI